MGPRFIGSIAIAVTGVVVVVGSQAFTPSVSGWLTFGVSLGALAVLAVVQRDRTRGRAQRIAHELKTERAVHVFEAIFAEARRRVTVR
jgi:hypothetical protein